MPSHITRTADGSWFVVNVFGEGSVDFRFSDREAGKSGELESVVSSITHVKQGGVDVSMPFGGRLNVLSLSSRESFARQMAKGVGMKLPFDSMLSEAIELVRKEVEKEKNWTWLSDVEQSNGDKWLFDPFILDNSTNVLFGKGGGGKTYMTLRLALSLATGKPFLGFKPSRTCKTLFIDYEDVAENLKERLVKICKGDGMKPVDGDPSESVCYYRPNGLPMNEAVQAVKRCVKENGIGLIIIDSAALACGGEPEKAESALRYFNALNKLGVATLTIAHETKSENHDYVFGSVFFHNSARNIWNFQAKDDFSFEYESKDVQAAMFHRKCNHGRRKANVYVKFVHNEDSTDITFGDPEAWSENMKDWQKIIRSLEAGPKTNHDIASDSGVKLEVVKARLTDLRKQGKVEKGTDNLWRVGKPVTGGVTGFEELSKRVTAPVTGNNWDGKNGSNNVK